MLTLIYPPPRGATSLHKTYFSLPSFHQWVQTQQPVLPVWPRWWQPHLLKKSYKIPIGQGHMAILFGSPLDATCAWADTLQRALFNATRSVTLQQKCSLFHLVCSAFFSYLNVKLQRSLYFSHRHPCTHISEPVMFVWTPEYQPALPPLQGQVCHVKKGRFRIGSWQKLSLLSFCCWVVTHLYSKSPVWTHYHLPVCKGMWGTKEKLGEGRIYLTIFFVNISSTLSGKHWKKSVRSWWKVWGMSPVRSS